MKSPRVFVLAAAAVACAAAASAQDLRKAIFAGDLAGVRAAVAQRAAVNARDSTGWTPVMLAATYAAGPRVEIVKALLDAGANIDSVNDQGETALITATHNAHDNAGVVRLLIERGANVNIARKDGRTALGGAAFNLEADEIRALVKAGARIDVVDSDGYTPLLLVANEAYMPPDASDGFVAGREKAVMACLEPLLAAGANPNAKNKKGDTPLSCAERWERYAHSATITQRLLQAGAK